MRVVVVDNDPTASADDVRAEMSQVFHCSLRWVVEPRRGIPFARNRAVREAGDVDFVAFIDDDEVADPGWLMALLNTQDAHDADVVAGPVEVESRATTPTWWVRLAPDLRPSPPDGTSLQLAATNNVLVSRTWLERYDGPFHQRLATIGSSDTELFLRMGVDGARMIWSADAVVTEHLSEQRMSLRWLARRRLRGHSTWAVLEHEILGVPRPIRLLRAAARVVEGVGWILLGILTGRRDRAYNGVLIAVGGVGGMIGATGYVFEEYGSAHGRRRRPIRVRLGRSDRALV